ncbi:uncharacterized protein LOC142320300 [Lycorma delicatula]|uniref:uncharacterized protein LOC142320300 n=1 Tax=Lycorma delicatula TaxID=130591 RepID=UPI003F5191BB
MECNGMIILNGRSSSDNSSNFTNLTFIGASMLDMTGVTSELIIVRMTYRRFGLIQPMISRNILSGKGDWTQYSIICFGTEAYNSDVVAAVAVSKNGMRYRRFICIPRIFDGNLQISPFGHSISTHRSSVVGNSGIDSKRYRRLIKPCSNDFSLFSGNIQISPLGSALSTFGSKILGNSGIKN